MSLLPRFDIRTFAEKPLVKSGVTGQHRKQLALGISRRERLRINTVRLKKIIMNEDREYDDKHKMYFGTFYHSFGIWEDYYFQLGEEPARLGEISLDAAEQFARDLILMDSEQAAVEQMRNDRVGAKSFHEIAHDIRDDKYWKFVYESDGEHEPFLLVASAVLNRIERDRERFS